MICLEEAVVRKLKATQHILTSIESCTGGLIAHLITNVSGASEVFYGSTIVYDNALKLELGVPEHTLSTEGAVSAKTAQTLALLGLERMQMNLKKHPSTSLVKPRGLICIATTGIAGPGGGSREKPVGLCYIGLAIEGHPPFIEEFLTKKNQSRIENKNQFAQKALEMIRNSI